MSDLVIIRTGRHWAHVLQRVGRSYRHVAVIPVPEEPTKD